MVELHLGKKQVPNNRTVLGFKKGVLTKML